MGNCVCANQNENIIIGKEVFVPLNGEENEENLMQNSKNVFNSRMKTYIRLKVSKTHGYHNESSIVQNETFIRNKSHGFNVDENSDSKKATRADSKIQNTNIYTDNKNINLNKRLNVVNNNNTLYLTQQSDSNKNENKIDSNIIKKDKPIKSGLIGKESTIVPNIPNSSSYTKQEERDLCKVLSTHIMFRHFNEDIIVEAVEMFILRKIEQSIFIFNKDEEASTFYIVKSGIVKLVSDDIVQLLQRFSTFGEISLCKENCVRKYSAKCESFTEVYILYKKDYLILNEKCAKEYDRESFELLIKSFYIMEFISNKEKDIFFQMCYAEKFNQNAQLQWTCNQNRKFLFIGKGKIKVSNKNHSVNGEKLSPGNLYGISNFFAQDFISEKSFITINEENTEILLIYEKVFIECFGLGYKKTLLQKCLLHLCQNDLFMRTIMKKLNIPIEIMLKFFYFKEYKKNDIVFSKGAINNNKAIIILSGALKASKNSKVVIAQKGVFYSSYFLFTSREFEEDVIANNNVFVLETTLTQINNTLIQNGINTEYIDIIYNMINTMQMFSQITLDKIIDIANEVEVFQYQKGEIIVQKDQMINNLYLISKGVIKVTLNNKKIKDIDKGNSFGELFILNEQRSIYNFIAKSDEVIIYTLSNESFIELLSDSNINEYIKRKMFLEESNISLNDFYYLSYLGRGRFGNVFLVHNEVCFYAIKAISKTFAESQKFGAKYVLYEKNALCSLDHPFILKLVKTFKNENWLFFLTEYIRGINLSEYLEKRKKKKNINETKFYAACLFIAINYIHGKKILHRDIKPANLMIDQSGYLHMIDFGASKKLKANHKTDTIIGTPNFIAPEVLLGKGYSFACDYWSAGIVVYYMYYSQLPFGNNSLEILNTYKEIIEKEVAFPDNTNLEINSLLTSLLDKSDKNRYSLFKMIQTHFFFRDINWNEMVQRRMKPPFIPIKDNRFREENFLNINSPFVNFIENEKYDTKQTVTLKASNSKKISHMNNKNNTTKDIPFNWFEDF